MENNSYSLCNFLIQAILRVFSLRRGRVKIGRGRYRPAGRRLKVRVGLRFRRPKLYRGKWRIKYRRKLRLLRISRRGIRMRYKRSWKRVIRRRRYGRRNRRRKLRRRRRRRRRRRLRRRKRRKIRRRRRRRRRLRRKARRRRRRRRRRGRCVLRVRYGRRWRKVYRRRRRLVFRLRRKNVRLRYVYFGWKTSCAYLNAVEFPPSKTPGRMSINFECRDFCLYDWSMVLSATINHRK